VGGSPHYGCKKVSSGRCLTDKKIELPLGGRKSAGGSVGRGRGGHEGGNLGRGRRDALRRKQKKKQKSMIEE